MVDESKGPTHRCAGPDGLALLRVRRWTLLDRYMVCTWAGGPDDPVLLTPHSMNDKAPDNVPGLFGDSAGLTNRVLPRFR
jgi:hypothetical protein